MKTEELTKLEQVLRNIPSVDLIARTDLAQKISAQDGSAVATELIRNVIDNARNEFVSNPAEVESLYRIPSRDEITQELIKRLLVVWRHTAHKSNQRLINATGVVIHTNLGRAPLSDRAQAAAVAGSAYCNLEYDIETGKRGKRGANVEDMICRLTGAEAALIVNNGAAAAFLTLHTLAYGGEVVLSRGEQVEIGGDFRVPDVLAASGATLVEIGTTNKTRLSDYERAVTENTKMFLKVHPSNYKIVGFAARPSINEISEVAKRKNVILYEDAGSGALVSFREYGLDDEPVIAESIAAGAHVVSFSADKLLGGPQAGIIVGKAELIEKIRRHPMYRTYRVGKLIYATLAATLLSYKAGRELDEIPVLQMLKQDKKLIAARALNLIKTIEEKRKNTDLTLRVIESRSVIGGGSAPNVQPETAAIVLRHSKLSDSQLESKLRRGKPAIITRIVDGSVTIDLRTVTPAEEAILVAALSSI